MKKLRLEALEVTSFETDGAAPREGGTVYAHGTNRNCTYFGCDTFQCPTNPDRDCTLGCTMNTCVTNETNCIAT